MTLTRKRLVKRMQRKAMGGVIYARLYDDGSVRIRADHPSNDAATEMLMAGTFLTIIQDSFRRLGIEPQVKTMGWRSDPPVTRS